MVVKNQQLNNDFTDDDLSSFQRSLEGPIKSYSPFKSACST